MLEVAGIGQLEFGFIFPSLSSFLKPAGLQQTPPSVKLSRPLSRRAASVENDMVHTVVLTFGKIGVMIPEWVRYGGRVIRRQLVFQLPHQRPLFLSEVSETAWTLTAYEFPPAGRKSITKERGCLISR